MISGATLKELRKLKNEEYICPGGRSCRGFIPPAGKPMSYNRCMEFPDCGCLRYDQQCDRIESAIEGGGQA